MCQNLMRNKDLFLKEFAENYKVLARDDKVPNVRITAAMILLKNIKKTSLLFHSLTRKITYLMKSLLKKSLKSSKMIQSKMFQILEIKLKKR